MRTIDNPVALVTGAAQGTMRSAQEMMDAAQATLASAQATMTAAQGTMASAQDAPTSFLPHSTLRA